ncbi:MAG TPA: family 16 glycoside hydrolase [Gemmataceae bacterium]|jgi:serine/threonine protein kinase|nr:family 16 glycoside hydrolase [Gemmataceae bacterium]
MDARPALHPSAQALAAFGRGKLDDTSAEQVIRHLDGCADCRKAVAAQPGDDFLDRLRAAHGESGTPLPEKSLAALPPRPTPADPNSGSQTLVPNLPPELAGHPQYEVLQELGHGGMGVVYLARHRLSGRREVLKVMNKELLSRPGSKERFLREIQSAALLDHPYVVKMYTAMEVGGLMVLVMEYVAGVDLDRLVKSGGPLPVATACLYVHQVALGLQHASEKGMAHRDVKPQNLILTRDGTRPVVKVLDFGLAKVRSEKGAEMDLTGEGRMLGTPHYIAPEQILDAAHADVRADVYSLGCTLYYLLTAGPPFAGRNSLFEILQAHRTVAPRPLNLARPEVPPELAAVVAKMMDKDVAKRYQRPVEVARALAPFLKPGQQSTTAQPPARPASPSLTEATSTEPWGTLTGGRTTDKRPPAPLRPAAKRRWLLGAGAAVGLLLLGLVGLWAAGVLKVKTRDGTIVLEGLPADAEVLVDGAKVTVTWADGGKRAEVYVKPGTHQVRVKKDGLEAQGDSVTLEEGGRQVFAVRLEKNAPPGGGDRPPAQQAKSEPFFNGEDLFGWEGLPGYWDAKPGYWDVKASAIVGRPPPGRPAHTFLVSRKKYRDFDLKFEARRKDGVGNSGVQFRSQLKDPDKFTVVGPQVEIDSINFSFPPGSLVTEPNLDPLQVKPSPDSLAELRKTYADDGFNTFHVRCVGKHVTVRVNGVTTVDGDFLSLPEEGVIAWQLHGRMAPKEVTFRNIRFTDLSRGAEGFVPLFNGRDRSGWKTHPAQPGDWRVEGGVLKGYGPDASHLYSERDDYKDFHLRVEARINEGGNSGVYVRAGSAPAWPANKPTWPFGYEAQIYNSDNASQPKTGSLFAGPDGAVVRVSESNAPPGEWFTMEVIARGNHIIVKVNGRTTADYTDDRQRFMRGRIALQTMDKNTVAEFRKVEIKELK